MELCLRFRRVLLAATAVLAMAGLPASAPAATFGFGDAALTGYGDTPSFHTLCGWSGTSCGHGGLGIRYARLMIPYNALGTYDSSSGTCVDTSADPNNWMGVNGVQTPTAQYVSNWLGEAQKDGLRPLISITWGNHNLAGEPDNPSYPTANGYRCGIQVLMQAAGPTWNRWVHDWEAFNEPEQGLCAKDAANFAALAQQAASAAGRSSDTIVAGGFASADDPLDATNHPDCGHPSGDWFIHDYVNAIKAKGLNPTVWSWHPYADVDASYTGTANSHQTGDLDAYLNQQFPNDPSFWITEVGVALNTAAYGQYLDGNPLAQANAAVGFKKLANAPNQAFGGQISRIYWYQFQTYGDGASNGSDRWDSALLGITSADGYEDGRGVPRASYCVLAYNDSPTQATRDNRCDSASTPNVPWTDWEDPSG